MNTKYMIAYMTEPAGGQPFSEWPLHITVVPWFTAPNSVESERSLVDALHKLFRKYRNQDEDLIAMVGKKVRFSPHLPVMLIDPTQDLSNLHTLIMNEINKLNMAVDDNRFCFDKYTPHITVRGDRSIKTGTKLIINKLTLIKSLSEKPKLRQKIADIRL